MNGLFTILRHSLYLSFIFTSNISAERVLPSPSGPYAVTYNTLQLNDDSRVDPLDPNHGQRRLMISSFFPVPSSACEETCTIPYMSHNTAAYVDVFFDRLGTQMPSGQLEKIQLQVCCKTTRQESNDVGTVPLVFLLNGFSNSRLVHSALAQQLASAGFAVITMDHTFESAVVEFPDGSLVPYLNDSSWNPAIPGALDPLQDIRLDDVRFVLSQLGSKEVVAKLIPGAPCGFNTERAAALGHSFGGSTSIKLIMDDSRFVGGLNLDGSQWGNLTDTERPGVLFGTTGVTPFPHNSTSDPTWAETLQHLKGWKAEIGLNNISHFGFTDISYLNGTGVLELPQGLPDVLLGPLNGRRSFQIVSTYATAFLDFVLRGKSTSLFDGPSEEFPEIVVL